MRVPSSLKLVIATWLAALVGALAGRSLAESARGMTAPGPVDAAMATRTHAR
jgi:hypothetical protein